MDKTLILKANQDYNEDRLKLITNTSIPLKSKIKKHDDLFKVYTRKLNALRSLKNEQIPKSETFFQIRVKVIDSCKEQYGKFPSKPQFIVETINQMGGSVSLQDLGKIMHYKLHLLENWVLKLNARSEIDIKGEYPNWTISLHKEG